MMVLGNGDRLCLGRSESLALCIDEKRYDEQAYSTHRYRDERHCRFLKLVRLLVEAANIL